METTIKVSVDTSILNITQENDKILFEFVPKCKEDDFPKKKFKPGDKVKLKDVMIDKRGVRLCSVTDMDMFIGKVLTVESYNFKGHIYLNETEHWEFAEDWLEPYSDTPVIGELAIFWESYKEYSRIRLYIHRTIEGYHDHMGMTWANAIKFISKEQFIEHIKD